MLKRFSTLAVTLAVLTVFSAAPAVSQSDGYVKLLKDSSAVDLSALAKTATFNSEDLNLQGYATFCLILDIGTVSGTSPTLDPKVQMSLDNGTTYLDTFPDGLNSETQAAMAQITASKETVECWRNTFPTIAGFATVGTAVTPRVRFVFTIGGTTPSFTFTNAYISTSESP